MVETAVAKASCGSQAATIEISTILTLHEDGVELSSRSVNLDTLLRSKKIVAGLGAKKFSSIEDPALLEVLYEMKRLSPAETAISLLPHPALSYQTDVAAMDAVRMQKKDAQPLFPDVAFGEYLSRRKK